jgi:hypothetical protein
MMKRDRSQRSGSIHLALVGLAILLLVPLAILEANSRYWGGGTAVDPLTVNFSQPTGLYQQAITLRLTAAHPDAQILFTTDGSLPLPGVATVYTRPLHLPVEPVNVAAVRARAVLPDGEMGPVTSASYFMGIEASVPIISLLTDPLDLYDQATGIIVNPLERGSEWERLTTIIYLDENGRLGFQTDAGLRIHGNTSRHYDKKSFRLYFRSEYGTAWLNYPLFVGGDVAKFKRLVLHAGGQEFPAHQANGTLLRNHLVANLVSQVGGYSAQSRPVILFINGQLWGIYNLRERLDNFFYDAHFSIKPAAGDVENWNHLQQFVLTHNLSDPVHYTYVQTQIDIANLIDYSIIRMIVANNDWPYNNISRFRGHSQGGRWQWIFWDSDYAFGLAPGSHVEIDMVNHVLVDQPWFLLSGLLQNHDFRDRFLGRTADLLNTTFSSKNVIAEIDGLAAALEPNIHFETTRWPGPGDWRASVEEIREFARRRPDIMRQHVVEGFELSGTAVITFNPASSGGTMIVNDYLLPEISWTGTYFAGTTVQLTAVPQPGYQFAGWESAALPQTAVINIPVTTSDQTITPIFEKASSQR